MFQYITPQDSIDDVVRKTRKEQEKAASTAQPQMHVCAFKHEAYNQKQVDELVSKVKKEGGSIVH